MKKAAAVIAALLLCVTGTSLAAVVSIKVVDDPSGLPQPFSRIAQKGDILVSGGQYTAVIAATPRPLWSSINYGHPDVAGHVAAFLPAGAAARPEAEFGYASVRLGKKSLPVSTSSVRVEGGAAVVVRSSCAGPDGLRLDILVRYTFALEAGRIDVSAEVRNAGKLEVKDLSFGLGASARQSYYFSPYNAKVFPTLNFRVYERPDHALAWHNPNPVETSDKPLPGLLRPGQAHKAAYALLAGAELSGLLDRLYRIARVPTVLAAVELKGAAGPTEVIVREPATGAVFFRTFVDRAVPLAFPLPAGTYAVRANMFPAVVDKTVRAGAGPEKNAWTLEAPALGRVRVSITDRRGRHVPGKVTFIGLAPTPTPYFAPVDPIETGRSWESLHNPVYPTKDGQEVELPAGT